MTFRVPKIKSCCGASLETGAKLIGCLNMFYFISGFSLPIIFASSPSYFIQRLIMETLSLNMGIFAVVMLYGIYQRDHHLIFPWILLQASFISIFSVSWVSHVVYLGLMDYRNPQLHIEFLITVKLALCTLVVYNFYRDLKDQAPQQC